nr:SDR family NAD(P)-dependent oxidoreductase [Rhodoferax sp.]
MDRLKGKVAIVTGGAVGIGRACAIRMAEQGAAIAVFDMLDSEGEALAAELVGRGFLSRYWLSTSAARPTCTAPLTPPRHISDV